MQTSHRGHKRHSILGCRALYGPFVRGLWLRWLKRMDTSEKEGSYRPYIFLFFFSISKRGGSEEEGREIKYFILEVE